MAGCRACVHRDRDQIDAEIVRGTPYRTIHAWSGISIGGLSRHRPHVAALVQLRSPRESAEHGSKLFRRAETLLDAADNVLVSAQKKGNARLVLSAITASKGLLELMMRADGTLTSAGALHLHAHQSAPEPADLELEDRSELAMILKRMTNFDPEKIEELRRLAQENDVPLLPAPSPTD